MTITEALAAAADWAGIELRSLTPAVFARARKAGIHDHARPRDWRKAKARALKASTRDTVAEHRSKRQLGAARRETKALVERAERAESALAFALALESQDAPPRIVPRLPAPAGKRRGTAALLCSDWHVEEIVDPRKVGGRNAYDPGEAERRIDRLTRGTLRLLRAHADVWHFDSLLVALMGDLMGGYIHPELIESNAMTPLQTALWLRPRIAGMLQTFLREAPAERLTVVCNYGNHGRTQDQKKPKIVTGAENNYEWMLYHILAKDFASEPRVTFHIATSDLLYLQCYDYTLRFTHGDAVKYNGGVGGVTIPLMKAISQWDTDVRADYTFAGHYHTYFPFPGGVLNGSLIGWSPASVRFKCRYELAKQAYCVIDEAEGLTAHHPVWVQARKAASAKIKAL